MLFDKSLKLAISAVLFQAVFADVTRQSAKQLQQSQQSQQSQIQPAIQSVNPSELEGKYLTAPDFEAQPVSDY